MGSQLTVQILKNGQPIGLQVFDSDATRTIKIGRLPSAQLKLEDPKVSRIHAVIEFSGTEASLIDMGSIVGTAVNGAKVHKTKLKHGDQILLGDTQLVVSFGAVGASVPEQTVISPPPVMAQPTVVAAPKARPTMPAFTPASQPVFAGPAVTAVTQPRFDPGTVAPMPMRRIGQERLRDAAVENRPHPGVAPEGQISADHRVLEMRYYWGEVLLNVFHFVKPKRITIGENKNCTVFLTSEGLPVEVFPLVRFQDGEYVLTFTHQMEGEVEIGGNVQKFEMLRGSSAAQRDDDLKNSYKVRLATDARVLLHWGGATFAMRFVAPPQAMANPMFKNVDLGYINMLIMLIVLHLAIGVTFKVYPYDTEELREDLFTDPNRFANIILEPDKKNQSTTDMLKKIQQTVEKKQEEQLEKKKEVVEKVPEQKTKIVVNVKAPVVKPQKTQDQKRQEVAQKFSQLFSGGGGGGAGSLLGGGGGGSLSGTLSNVIGTAGRGSATAGLAGLGIRGGLLTGGGVGTSQGMAGIGTAGRLGGGGMAYGSGIGLGARRDTGVISLSTPVIMGALPKEVILKVIKDNANQIRYCYEVELQKNQNLEGRVKIKWVIGATGDVVKVQLNETTLKNDAVESCMMNKIKGWKFPAPAGGGIVEVVYPWVLKAS